MVSLTGPETLLCPLPLQVNEVTPAGSGSLTATLVAVLGPLFWKVTSPDSAVPAAWALLGRPVMVVARSAEPVPLTTTLALLLELFGSVVVAAMLDVALAVPPLAGMVALKLTVTVSPGLSDVGSEVPVKVMVQSAPTVAPAPAIVVPLYLMAVTVEPGGTFAL